MSLQFPARLSAAALGAAVLVGVAAAPAHAATWTPEHGTPSGTFVSADGDLMEFVLYDNFATEDIRAVVVTASGEETEIQVDFITEDDMGAVFLPDIEQALGGDLAQPYEVHVYGAGQLAFGAAFAADGTMTPVEAEEFIPFEDWAEVATWRVYTDQNATVVESLVTEDGGVRMGSASDGVGGYTAVRIEEPAGRAEYARRQRGFAERGQALRARGPRALGLPCWGKQGRGPQRPGPPARLFPAADRRPAPAVPAARSGAAAGRRRGGAG